MGKRVKEIQRFSMTLSMSNPLQRRAWELISSLPAGERTGAVSLAVCQAFGSREIVDEVGKTVREILRQELRGIRMEAPAKTVPPKPSGVRVATDNVTGDVADLLTTLNSGSLTEFQRKINKG